MAVQRDRYVRDSRGRRRGIILPLSEYYELMEDLHDLAIIAERRDEETIPWEEVERQLKADGLLPN